MSCRFFASLGFSLFSTNQAKNIACCWGPDSSQEEISNSMEQRIDQRPERTFTFESFRGISSEKATLPRKGRTRPGSPLAVPEMVSTSPNPKLPRGCISDSMRWTLLFCFKLVGLALFFPGYSGTLFCYVSSLPWNMTKEWNKYLSCGMSRPRVELPRSTAARYLKPSLFCWLSRVSPGCCKQRAFVWPLTGDGKPRALETPKPWGLGCFQRSGAFGWRSVGWCSAFHWAPEARKAVIRTFQRP